MSGPKLPASVGAAQARAWLTSTCDSLQDYGRQVPPPEEQGDAATRQRLEAVGTFLAEVRSAIMRETFQRRRQALGSSPLDVPAEAVAEHPLDKLCPSGVPVDAPPQPMLLLASFGDLLALQALCGAFADALEKDFEEGAEKGGVH